MDHAATLFDFYKCFCKKQKIFTIKLSAIRIKLVQNYSMRDKIKTKEREIHGIFSIFMKSMSTSLIKNDPYLFNFNTNSKILILIFFSVFHINILHFEFSG